ncbi:serine/threonine-protein kinase [Calothrix sp. PCC 7507]|uniref:serine/threonine-protein kinase n=1 Tax=Calothrix sp. PCC 7507 TaxID=99598 RepID=UPI00029EF3D8|nr:serine/threonine-protein kinase [Calothrix sp. PCC 7507]AFY32403.1 serine/threonine protein kinase [Calothrix sp. PCC 7507]
MQPPITVGTVLQNRYRTIQILGQGGFGRTYLAEDQRRFNELCAIKELIPTATGAYVWEKAQELFQREAATLYQIEHPQVPKFRERFEQDKRLFLVEDYIAGKTYRDILSERQAVGQTLTEQEVLELIGSLLPVLEHIHSRGIIHRDISPENIILRDSDTKPVLIDFGVVKELASRLQSPDSTTPVTSVGKLGYAPTEQLQTGQAYPSSDLYALAVTAIVLLTGREPADLFDETQLSWNWQRWTRVDPRFAQVLQRMLSFVPGDRYQTTTDVAQALESIDKSSASAPQLSNVQTIAVGRRPDLVAPAASNKPNPIIPPSDKSSILDNPLAIGAIGSAVVILAGFGSWALVSSIRSQSQAPSPETPPQTFPSPVIPSGSTLFSPTPTSTPTSSEPTRLSKRLIFGASNIAAVENTIKENQVIQYTFSAQKGLKLTTFVDPGSSILLTVLGANQQPIDDQAKQVPFYEGTLPVTGRYTIELSLVPGISESDYTLNVALEKLAQPIPTSIPTPVEIPTNSPTPIPTETIKIPTPTPTETPTETPIPNAEQSNSPGGGSIDPVTIPRN